MSQNILSPELPIATGPTGKIRRAHLSMQRCADAVFSARNITNDQCSMLWIVWRRQGIRQNELAQELFTDPNTVTAMLVRLEKRGLIRRQVCAEDGRARRVSLTPSGRKLVSRLYEDWTQMRLRLREIFAGEAGQEALRLLDEVCAVMTGERDRLLEERKAPSRKSAHLAKAPPAPQRPALASSLAT